MDTTGVIAPGIFVLPNEILLSIFNVFSTESLIPFTPTCRHFHSLILKVIHHRLQIAAGLDGHTLYLECHPPSARFTAAKFFCTSLGTDGLQDLLQQDFDVESSFVGEVAKLGKLYSRFRPQRKEPEFKVAQRHPAGDIPGSRTHPSTSAAAQASGDASDAVMETVTIDAQDLFSQLTTLAYLAKREVSKGLLLSIQEVSEGTIRVWRDWLAKHCESKQWTDGDTVPIHREAAQTEVSGKGKARADSVAAFPDLRKEPNALWVNTRGSDLVGIKFRVAERKWRQANPVLFSNDIEVAVSYEVEFQEVYIRTMHLLLKLEEAEQQLANDSGKAIVFGAYAGLQEFDTAGNPRR